MTIKRELAAFLCPHVFAGARRVLFASRDGGDWQFLCGGDHDARERPHVVGLNHVFELDPTLLAIADLEPEWEAERSTPGGPWIRARTSKVQAD